MSHPWRSINESRSGEFIWGMCNRAVGLFIECLQRSLEFRFYLVRNRKLVIACELKTDGIKLNFRAYYLQARFGKKSFSSTETKHSVIVLAGPDIKGMSSEVAKRRWN